MNIATLRLLLLALFSCFNLICTSVMSEGQTLSRAESEARLRMMLQIAREQNDHHLVHAVERLERELKKSISDDAEIKLRQIEKQVGIDPGGWSMAGQPLFHPTPEMVKRSILLQPKLAAAMRSHDPAQVRAVTSEMLSLLGDQAGVPDGRRVGVKREPKIIDEADATKLFLEALAEEGRFIRQLSEGKLLPDQMLRVYAYLLDAVVTVRPFVTKYHSDSLPELDKLAFGIAGILTKLQQRDGIFPFPDLRGKNIRFGDMIEKRILAGQVVVRDGWIVSADPEGGSQFDTGLCGTAVLSAGQLYSNREWTQAGLLAADWSLSQPCCNNFNYNAFSISLLTHAYRVTAEAKYLETALEKFRVGVAPGQAPNGRWIDAHNARTVYHVIILRSLGDLASCLPENMNAERAEIDRIAVPAVQALLDEFEAMGVTVEALPELMTLAVLYPNDQRLRLAVQEMATVIVAKCSDGKRVKLGAQPNQLAAVIPACKAFMKLSLSNPQSTTQMPATSR